MMRHDAVKNADRSARVLALLYGTKYARVEEGTTAKTFLVYLLMGYGLLARTDSVEKLIRVQSRPEG